MSNNGGIPFLDLVTPHLELEDQLVSVFRTALRSASFIGGAAVDDFETDFTRFCDTEYCVGVSSGTDALRLALLAAGVKKGDTVITVPNTFIATTEAISQTGASPDFVDVDERTYNMDAGKLRDYLQIYCDADKMGRLINRKTKRPVTAVVPVHLYGQPADMDPILDIAATYNLMVIEDACQAHGAQYFSKKANRWKRVGSMGRAAAFSFYPGKNLGACGEGGAVTTNAADLAQQVRMLRDHGQLQKYYHEIEGYNGRLDAIQASILRIKLEHLPGWNRKRRDNAYRYHGLLGPMIESIVIPFEPRWARAVYHLYVIRVHNRDDLKLHLSRCGIGTGIHYPIPLHLQRPYQKLGYRKGDFPVSEKSASEILSLPMYPQLGFDQQSHVVREIMQFLSRQSTSILDVFVVPAQSIPDAN